MPDIDSKEHLRRIKSFVVRSSRMTVGQKRGWDEYWSSFGLEPSETALDFESLFGNSNPVVFEIGFGMGASLYDMAVANPEQNFLGVEVHRPGVGALLAQAGDAGLKNLKLACCDANLLIDKMLPENSLHRLQLYFPDPWHKKRHHKRRLVQPEFVRRLEPLLQVGGQLHMATDWEPYAEHMMSVLEDSRAFRNTAGKGCYSEKPAYRPETKFERRGVSLGHGVWDLVFEKYDTQA